MSGRFGFQLGFPRPSRERREEGPFRLLVMADLSGPRRGTDASGLAERRPIFVDVDVLEQLMARIAPSLEVVLPQLAEPVSIVFRELDDFHPDRLFARLPAFAALRDLRARLADPKTFAAAAVELERLGAVPSAGPGATEPAPAEDAAATMARLLGGAPVKIPAGGRTAEASSALSRLFQEAVAPHVVHASEADQRLYLSALDERVARLMRGLLHDPAVQGLEAAWRGLAWVVTSLPTGEDLTVHVLDVRGADLLADLRAAHADLPRTTLYRLLVEETLGTPGGVPWSLIAADLTLGPGGDDIGLAAALAALGAAAGAPFIAAASPRLLGCESLAATPDLRDWQPLAPDAAQRWRELRRFDLAPWLGLALPRVLLRRPYGRRSEPIEAFAFEELTGTDDHERFLWGSPALAVAILCAQAALEGDMARTAGATIDGLPAHTLIDPDGEHRLQACAEVVLSDRAATAILAQGLMPLLSHPQQPSVLLPRPQSIAEPASPLA